MEIILIENVDALGRAGEIVNVKDGYARNYLIPKKMALMATKGNIRRMDEFKKRIEESQLKEKATAEEAAARIEAVALSIARKAGENERLFGSVTSMDIHAALVEKGIEVDRRKIQLDEPIKSLGEFQIPIKLHPDVSTQVSVSVVQA